MSELRETASTWLKAIGTTPREIEDPATEWHLEFDYPPKTGHHMHVIGPKGQRDRLIIATATQVSGDHLKAFGELDDSSKQDFLFKLRHALNQLDVDFQLDGATSPLDCPARFQVLVTRYQDGLTLDSFAMSVGSVFKTELKAVWTIQEEFGNDGDGDIGRRFDFRRFGV